MIGAIGGQRGGVDPSQRMQHRFEKMDSDGNGGISSEEFSLKPLEDGVSAEKISELFSQIDSDGDGSLTSDELKSHHEEMGPPPRGGRKGPPPGMGKEMVSQLQSAVESGDDELIKSLLETLSDGYEENKSSSDASVSVLLDTFA